MKVAKLLSLQLISLYRIIRPLLWTNMSEFHVKRYFKYHNYSNAQVVSWIKSDSRKTTDCISWKAYLPSIYIISYLIFNLILPLSDLLSADNRVHPPLTWLQISSLQVKQRDTLNPKKPFSLCTIPHAESWKLPKLGLSIVISHL